MKDQQFYATAAQVIPIFLLALAFEHRFFEPRDETVAEALFLISLLVALAGGETLALLALLTEDAERFTKPMVLAGLAWGGIGLFVPFFLPRTRVLAQKLPERGVRAIRIIGWPLVLLGVVLATLITRSDAVIPGAIFVLWMSVACLWVFISSAQEVGALRALKRDRERAEQADASAPQDVSPTVSRTEGDRIERSEPEQTGKAQ